MSLVKVGSTPINPGLPSLAMLLFNRLVRGKLQRFSRPSIMCDIDEGKYPTLKWQVAPIKK